MDNHAVILIVDASKYMRDYTQKALKHQGYNDAIEAVDGKNALDVMMEYKVDLIISELQMPKVSGLDLLKAISNHSTLKNIPCIISTSDISSDSFKEAMEIGVDYIKKPFTSSELDSKIKSIDGNEL